MVFWNKQLTQGYIRWYVIGSSKWGRRRDFPEYAGKKLCTTCAHALFSSAFESEGEEELSEEEEITASTDLRTTLTDFISLRNFLDEAGIVAEAFACPKCGGMLDIPTKGKLLICKHCGEPIKPADIYDKIKHLTE